MPFRSQRYMGHYQLTVENSQQNLFHMPVRADGHQFIDQEAA